MNRIDGYSDVNQIEFYLEQLLREMKKLAVLTEESMDSIRNIIQMLEKLHEDSREIHQYEEQISRLHEFMYYNQDFSQKFAKITECNRASAGPSNHNHTFNDIPAAQEETMELLERVWGGTEKGTEQAPVAEPQAVELQKVQFSAVAPKTMERGAYSLIHVVMYEEAYRYIVDELVENMEDASLEVKSGVQKISVDSLIKIELTSPDLLIEDDVETGVWEGEYLNFSFAIQIPEDFEKKQILFIASVYINDVISTKLKFLVKCDANAVQELQLTRQDILSAFVSYASQDRNRVAAIIQGMKKARPDLDVFFDVDSLRSGEEWESTLRTEIEKRDILYLCWSHFARDSKWVDEEWRYALAHKGPECIEPVPLESPDYCPPPMELNYKHFNDKLLYIINSNIDT